MSGSLLAAVRRHGVVVTIRDGDLVCRAPRGVLTDEAREVLAVLKSDILVELEAEASGWMRNPDGPGRVETPERAARCVHDDDVLAPDDPIHCAEHRARMAARSGRGAGDDPRGEARSARAVPAAGAGGHRPAWRCICTSTERRHRPEWGDWVCAWCGLIAPAPTDGRRGLPAHPSRAARATVTPTSTMVPLARRGDLSEQ